MCTMCVCLVPKEAEKWHQSPLELELHPDSCEPVLGTKPGSSVRATSANCQSSLQPLSFLFSDRVSRTPGWRCVHYVVEDDLEILVSVHRH